MRYTMILLGMLMALGAAGWALGQVEGSKHDFSSKDWAQDDLCAACHTPHQHEPPKAAPLWDSNADLSRRFGSAVGTKNEPALGTLMCMRCHDGTIAKDTLGALKQERFVNKENPALFRSAHGFSDHPVNVRYPAVDRGYKPPATLAAQGYVSLPDGKVQCSSCHDPHDQARQEYMLVMSNNRSALCLSCHNK